MTPKSETLGFYPGPVFEFLTRLKFGFVKIKVTKLGEEVRD